jgi:opacity protein-like surface antigen
VKKVLIILSLMVFGAFSMVNAQDVEGMFNVTPFAGIGMPMGDMGDEDEANLKMGFKFGGGAEYFFTNNVGLGLDFTYASFGSDTEGSDAKYNAMMIGALGKYMFMPESMYRPYAVAGFGMLMSKTTEAYNGEDVEWDNKFYFKAGFGLKYWVSEMITVFGELGFDYLMLDGATGEADGTEVGEVDGNYYFIDFKAGVNIWFGGME